MKKSLTLFVSIIVAFMATTVSAQSLKDILGSLGKGNSEESTTSSTTSSSTADKLGDLLGTIGKLTGNDKMSISDLVGTWSYQGAAVSFKSDNLLKKAGGIAGVSAIEEKIEPYFNKVGLKNLTIEFGADSTFTMSLKKVKLSGTVSATGDGYTFDFAFKAAGKVNLGTMTGYVAREATNKISLTFDATKLITLVDKIASVSGNSSLKAVSSLLDGYDGLTLGFKLQK